MLIQRCINVVQRYFDVASTLCNVVSTLFQRRCPTLYQRCATVENRRRILFHFQRRINVISTLIHNVETTLIRRWNVGWVGQFPHSFGQKARNCRNCASPQNFHSRKRLNYFCIFLCQGFLSWTLTIQKAAPEERRPPFIPDSHFHPHTIIQTFICNFVCEMTTAYFLSHHM